MKSISVLVFSFALLSCTHSVTGAETMKYNAPAVDGVALSREELHDFPEKALLGSPVHARRLATHYMVAQPSREDAIFWALIAAENGDVNGKYMAGFLMKDSVDPRLQKRAKFWLTQAAKSGHLLASDLLKEIERSPK
jgi:TPR repeat protein